MTPVALEFLACEQVLDRISDYLDAELDPRRASGVALHLALCAGCARFASELAATVAALHRLRAGRAAAAATRSPP
jgi:anti-sigma factor RsiW